MDGKTALVLGASGLVGSALLQLLLADDRFAEVRIFVRRELNIQHTKLKEFLVDFDSIEEWKDQLRGHILFSALGTTLKKAGSKDAQFKIDYEYQYNVAKAASLNGVPYYVLVSAAMSSPKSKLFYSRIKGELERDVCTLPFRAIHIMRPGLLQGKRSEKRSGEELSLRFIKFLNRIGIAKSQKPVPAETVAFAMINSSLSPKKGVHKYTLLEVFDMAGIGIW